MTLVNAFVRYIFHYISKPTVSSSSWPPPVGCGPLSGGKWIEYEERVIITYFEPGHSL